MNLIGSRAASTAKAATAAITTTSAAVGKYNSA